LTHGAGANDGNVFKCGVHIEKIMADIQTTNAS
jgi:hypothetical protein